MQFSYTAKKFIIRANFFKLYQKEENVDQRRNKTSYCNFSKTDCSIFPIPLLFHVHDLDDAASVNASLMVREKIRVFRGHDLIMQHPTTIK